MRTLQYASFILLAAISAVASAVPLQITGVYNGQINGEPVHATASGQMDTTGLVVNRFELEFHALPSTVNPFIAGNSWKSSYHQTAVLPVGGAVNLFALAGDDYIAGRTVRWSSLPGDELRFMADVTIDSGIINAVTTVEGSYHGPTDLIGVTGYRTLWTQIDATSIEVAVEATILRANGESFDAQIISVYSGLEGLMPTHQQAGGQTFFNQVFDGTTMSFDWLGFVAPVPEPGSIALIGLALCGLAYSRRSAA